MISYVRTAKWARTIAKATVANTQAKQMMGGGNPLTGAATRANASTFCASCNRWHRPGKTCSNAMKGQVWKAKRVSHADVNSGNPYRNNGGQFGGQPGGEKGGAAKKDYHAAMKPHNEPTPPTQAPQPEMAQAPQTPMSTSQALPPMLTGHTLLSQPAPEQAPPDATSQSLVDNSGFMQNIETNYLNALQRWQALYG